METAYSFSSGPVSWMGIQLFAGEEFDSFLADPVARRLHDDEGRESLSACLRGLSTTGFSEKNLELILEAEVEEARDWAVGEAIAEAYLADNRTLFWPWNSERDKRCPLASLPGADLVGFDVSGPEPRLALGEVKTSSDLDSPPNVMYGRSGITHQLEQLAQNLALLMQLLKYLHPRCKGEPSEQYFHSAAKSLLFAGPENVSLFGVLVRDTRPDPKDLKSRGIVLAKLVTSPTSCELVAIYLPCSISELPNRVKGKLT